MDHPVWQNLDALLDASSGEDIALQYVSDEELTPIEFLAACASQGPLMVSWKKRVEVLKAARIAIAKDNKRAFGFAETLFRDLLNAQPYEEEGAAQLVEVLLDIVRILDVKVATESLLKCLYDPVVTRISNPETAQRLGRNIVDTLESEIGTFTVQKLLLFQSFREREELKEGDTDSEDSHSDWVNTSDSTESSLAERDLGCPVTSSAAAAWVLAPHFIEPHVLTSYGRFAWGVKHATTLLGLPSNTLAAQRGFELFSSFGKVEFPSKPIRDFDFVEEAYDCTIAALKFATAEQSLVCRDIVAGFINTCDPLSVRLDILTRLVTDTALTPPMRGWAIDLLRKNMLGSPGISATKVMNIVLELLEAGDGTDANIGPACFSTLQLMGIRVRNGDDRFREAVEPSKIKIIEILSGLHRAAKESESELSKEDSFELRYATTTSDESTSSVLKRVDAPKGYLTPQAEYGRARLIAGIIEPLLELYQAL